MNIKERILEKKEIVIAIIIALLIIGWGIISLMDTFSAKENILDNTSFEKSSLLDENLITESEKIKVYITGEINNPGVIEIEEGERVEDLVNKAGGVTNNADLSKVNLAYKLEDGQKVYIPNKNENFENEIISTENGENVIQEMKSSSKSGKININSASIEKLCELPGVGEAMAEKIIMYREENGKFNSIEDLKNVSGIGEKKYESLKDFIVAK